MLTQSAQLSSDPSTQPGPGTASSTACGELYQTAVHDSLSDTSGVTQPLVSTAIPIDNREQGVHHQTIDSVVQQIATIHHHHHDLAVCRQQVQAEQGHPIREYSVLVQPQHSLVLFHQLPDSQPSSFPQRNKTQLS